MKHTEGKMWASDRGEVGTEPMMGIKLCRTSGESHDAAMENARRIALTWNAFDGISNDDIAAGKYKVVPT